MFACCMTPHVSKTSTVLMLLAISPPPQGGGGGLLRPKATRKCKHGLTRLLSEPKAMYIHQKAAASVSCNRNSICQDAASPGMTLQKASIADTAADDHSMERATSALGIRIWAHGPLNTTPWTYTHAASLQTLIPVQNNGWPHGQSHGDTSQMQQGVCKREVPRVGPCLAVCSWMAAGRPRSSRWMGKPGR